MLQRPLLAAALLAAILAGCADAPDARPPEAEFLVAAGDSTYWVRPARNGLRLRGSPILLARVDERFHEVFVTDDERLYDDASFVGQRVWRRDLVRGDSVLVFEDTLAPALARRWASQQAGARLLGPSDAPADEPLASAMVEVAVIAVHGPYLSFEYHADVESEDERPWHTTRRGVVDLRSGRQMSLADLFGAPVARRLVTAARRNYLETVDSLVQSGDRRAATLAASLDAFAFDASSFTLGGDARAPAVGFFVPGRGEGDAGEVAIPIPELPVPAPGWWPEVRAGLPAGDDESPADRWEHQGYAVTAERGALTARLTLTDAADRHWPIGTVQAPVHHILWLDTPAVDSATRRGLSRAFDEAVFYDETMRTASRPIPFALTSDANRQARAREPSRDVRAHDAPGRQQPRPRLRGRRARDDGQGCRHRRVPALPHQRRDRID